MRSWIRSACVLLLLASLASPLAAADAPPAHARPQVLAPLDILWDLLEPLVTLFAPLGTKSEPDGTLNPPGPSSPMTTDGGPLDDPGLGGKVDPDG
jgi:hypothetical protein